MEYYGYSGKILYVDLTTGQSRTEPLDLEMAKKFIGGTGVGERLLYEILEPGIDPLSPENVIVITAGPLIGAGVPGVGKINMIAKSIIPSDKEGTKYHIARASGSSLRFGTMMKAAGYDAIIVTGRAKTPVYLKIENDYVELCDAKESWGKEDIYETTDVLTKRHKGCGVIAIGKASENLIGDSFAWVDKACSIGRNSGAPVMGSKNLKAIAVHGTKGVRIWDRRRFIKFIEGVTEEAMKIKAFQASVSMKGGGAQYLGSKWAEYYPPEIWDNTVTSRIACTGCPIACRGVHTIREGEFAGDTVCKYPFMHIPIYGRRMEFTDYRHSMKFIDILDRYGLSITVGVGMIMFLVRLYERGKITKEDIDGIELKMGDIHSYKKLLDKFVNREGIGEYMAQGWFALSERVGVDASTDMAGDNIEKGVSTLYDARFTDLSPVRLACLTNTRAGMHIHPVVYILDQPMDAILKWARGIAMTEEEIARIFTDDDFNNGRFLKHCEDEECVLWALGVCMMLTLPQIYNFSNLADAYEIVTGIKTTPQEFKRAGERIWNVGKILNVREGFTRADDKLPGLWARVIDEPIKSSRGDITLTDYYGRRITHASLEKMLDDYYDERGWDIIRGVPTKEKLVELGLPELAIAAEA